MNTSNLSQTAPLVAVPSLSPSLAWAHWPLHHAKAFLMHAFGAEGSTFSASQDASYPLPDMPLRFSNKSIYTPSQDWYGYR